MNDFSPITRRIVAVSLLLMLISMAFRVGIQPLYHWCVDALETRRDIYFELDRAQRSLEESRNVSEAAITELEGRVTASLMPGANDAEATTQLQALLDGLVKEQGLAVEGIQSIAPQALASGTRIGVELRASGGERSVARLLLGIESRQPLMHIERVHLRNQNGLGPGVEGKEPRVQLEASIYAYMQPHRGGNP